MIQDISYRCPECGKKFRIHVRGKYEKPYVSVSCLFCSRRLRIEVREIMEKLADQQDVHSKTVDDINFEYKLLEKKKPAHPVRMVLNIKYDHRK
jgi:transcription elongation factor Elf1